MPMYTPKMSGPLRWLMKLWRSRINETLFSDTKRCPMEQLVWGERSE